MNDFYCLQPKWIVFFCEKKKSNFLQSNREKNRHSTTVSISILKQDDDSEISFHLLKTDVFVVDIKFCNSSYSYEDAMKPGMFCAGRKKTGKTNYSIQNNIYW